MTKFYPGDIVKFEFAAKKNGCFFAEVTGTQENGEVVGVLSAYGTTSVYDGVDLGYGPIFLGMGSRLTLVESANRVADVFAFVGPKPQPRPLTPAITTPFARDRATVVDSRGHRVLIVDGPETDQTEDVALAGLIVDLLNKHFGV